MRKFSTFRPMMAIAFAVTAYCAAQSDFKPETHLTGNSLQGWKSVGQAEWKIQNGELSGTANAGGAGLLIKESGLQDFQLFADFQCEGTCEAGILSRIEKKSDGSMTAILTSLAGADLGSYSVTLDADGKEIKRQKLALAPPEFGPPPSNARPATGTAAPAEAGATPARRGGGAVGPGGQAPGVARRPSAALKAAGEWNATEVLVDDENVKWTINGGNTPESAAPQEGYGSFGFYTKGPGTVHFKSVGWKDLNHIVRLKEVTSPHFRKQQISDFYYGWDASAADINHDGNMDIVSGPFFYAGPDFTTRFRYRAGRTYNPSSEYAPDMINFTMDVNGDGWPDILASDQAAGSRPVDLYINPKGEARRWDKYRILPKISTELVIMKDIDGDGKPEIIFGGGGEYSYAKPGTDPTAPWVVHPLSENIGRVNNHGFGVGDINGDGRTDVVVPSGWFEHPATDNGKAWPFHAASFGGGGGEIGIYDVNGDGLVDVVTSLEAHGFGLAWYEQKKDKGEIAFVEHKIAGDYSTKNAGGVTFSQPHSSRFADMDGDGIPDFIVGKSFFHHLETFGDPDIYGPPVLYVYRTVRNPKAPGGAEFVPELIDNHSGVGSAFEVMDINKDGNPDIVVQTGLGTFIFFGKDKHWPKVAADKSAAQ